MGALHENVFHGVGNVERDIKRKGSEVPSFIPPDIFDHNLVRGICVRTLDN